MCFRIIFQKQICKLALESSAIAQLIVKLIGVFISQLLDGSAYICVFEQFSRIMTFLSDIFVYLILAFVYIVSLVLFFKPLPYLVSGRTALGYLEPVYTRSCRIRRGDNLDDVAVFKLVIYGHHLSVDSCPYTFAAYVRMDLECKIQRSGSCRKFYHVALRSEYEHLT